MPSSSSSQQVQSTEGRSPSPEVVLSITTTPQRLVNIARRFEVDKNSALQEARELRRKLADLSNMNDQDCDPEAPLSKRSRTHDPGDSPDPEILVINAGHQFVILYSPWLRLGEETFKVEYIEESIEVERFENGDNKVQGQLREIRKILGIQLTTEMTSEAWIAKAFLKGMRAQRSNTATRLRRHCAAIFGVCESDMLRTEVRKEKFRTRIGWVGTGPGLGSYSSVDVEILHKDYAGSYDIRNAFLNPILMWVFIAIIRGPTAAKEAMNGIQSNPKTDTMARKHGIRHTTPGAIAASVVLARWALSADDFLQNVGTNTGINYGNDFEEYLEVLMTGLRRKKKSILNVFKEWDRIIFPNSDSSLVRTDRDASSSGLKTAMRMLDADSEDEEA